MFKLRSTGDFGNFKKFAKRATSAIVWSPLDELGRRGVEALAQNTPVETGLTASSWGYEIVKKGGVTRLIWTNSHINDGVPIAVILQYGHGTGTGGYVEGVDYINPAIRPIFDEIADRVWSIIKG